MNKWLIALSTALCSICAVSTLTADSFQESSSGVTFPDQVSFDYQGTHYNLTATGASVRTKLIIKVYAIAHYMEPLEHLERDIFKQILNNNGAKQFTFNWLRDVDRSKVIDAYHESFAKVFGRDLSSLQNDIDQYLSFFGDVHNHDEHVVRWLRDGTVEVYFNQAKQGSVKNEKFARGLWSIWFGKNSPVNRDNLISLLH